MSASLNGSGQLVIGFSNSTAVTVGRIEYKTEFRTTSTYIQWKYTHEGSGSWRNVIAIADITGGDGEDGVTDGIAKFRHGTLNGNVALPGAHTSTWYKAVYVDTGNTSGTKTYMIKLVLAVYLDSNDLPQVGLNTSSGALSTGITSTAPISSTIYAKPPTGANFTTVSPCQIEFSFILSTSSRYIQAYVRSIQQGAGSSLRHLQSRIFCYELN